MGSGVHYLVVQAPDPPQPLPWPDAPPATENSEQSKHFPLRLDLTATQDAWVEVETDGHAACAKLVRADESLSFEAVGRIRFKTGNVYGLQISLNGERVGSAGASGRVRAVEFTDKGIRDLKAATHIVKS